MRLIRAVKLSPEKLVMEITNGKHRYDDISVKPLTTASYSATLLRSVRECYGTGHYSNYTGGAATLIANESDSVDNPQNYVVAFLGTQQDGRNAAHRLLKCVAGTLSFVISADVIGYRRA